MIISRNSKKKIFHSENVELCPYARRIKKENRQHVEESRATQNGYCACSWCLGQHGAYLRLMKNPNQFGKFKIRMMYYWDRENKALCVKTKAGMWKITRDDFEDATVFHMNSSVFNKFKETSGWPKTQRKHFHKQTDIDPNSSLSRILYYISEHDRAKLVSGGDWKKLPQDTKRQKKHYKSAKKREQKKQIRNVYKIFKQLEQKKGA